MDRIALVVGASAITGSNLAEKPDLSRLASLWHTDLDLGRSIEVMMVMSESRKSGFTVYQRTEESILDLFMQLRKDHLIP